MNKVVKVLLALTALLFTVVLAAVVLLVTLDPNEHKDWIADRFHEDTGRTLNLAGDVQFSVYPWLGISVEDVTVGGAGSSEERFFHADSARVRVKLMPILQGRYEIDTVRLHGAELNLAVNEDGVGNWEDLAADDETADSEQSAPPLANIVLGGVDVRDASVSFEDRRQNLRYDISAFNMRTGELVYGEPIELDINFNGAASQPELAAAVVLNGTVAYDAGGSRYDINPLRLAATLRGPNVPDGSAELNLDTALNLDLAADTLSVSSLELNALDTVMRASANGSAIQTDRPIYQIRANLSGQDMAVLFRVLERDDLAARISELDSPAFNLELALESDLGRGNIDVPELEGSLLGADISGRLQASNLQSETPRVQGRLNASGPDLPTLIEVAGQVQGGNDSPLSEYGRQLSQVPDRSFSINTDFDADMARGEVRVPTLDLRLLGAAITGELAASGLDSEAPLVRGRLNASGPDLPLLLQIAGQLQGGAESPLNRTGRQLREGVANRAFNVDAQFDANLEQGDIQVPVLSARMLGFQLSGDLSSRGMRSSNGSVQGSLSVSGNNLREVLAALEQPDLAEVMQSMTLRVDVQGSRENLVLSPFDLNLVLAGPRIPNSPVTVALSADSALDLEQESLALESFSLTGLGLDARGSLAASGIFAAPRVEGELNIAPFNLRRVLQQLNQDVPPTADARVLERVALSTAFAGSARDLRLDNLTLNVDDTNLRGNAALSELDAPNPAITFAFDVDRLNADLYLPPPGEGAESGASPGAEIPRDMLRGLQLDGELNVGNLTLSNLEFSELALAMKAENGIISLTPSTNLYDGSYTGDIGLDVSADIPRASITSTLSGINVAPLLQDFMQANYVSGTGNIELSLNASGLDTAALKSSLDGSGRIELSDGVLQGVDIGGVLRQVESMIRNRRLGTVDRGQQTAFENFSATLLIENGLVTSDDLQVEARGFEVSGRGTLIDLGNDTIDYRMMATVTAEPDDAEQYDIGGYSLPIACTGNIESPRCLPDTEEILRAALSSAVQRGVTDLLERALGVEGQQQDQPDGQGSPSQQAPEQEQQEAPQDPATQILNRALENLLR